MSVTVLEYRSPLRAWLVQVAYLLLMSDMGGSDLILDPTDCHLKGGGVHLCVSCGVALVCPLSSPGCHRLAR